MLCAKQDTKSGRVKLKLQWVENPLSPFASPEKEAPGQALSVGGHRSRLSVGLDSASSYSGVARTQVGRSCATRHTACLTAR